MIDLIESIDQFVIRRDKTRQEKRAETHGTKREAFYVSEAGKCPRKIAYEFFGLPKKQLDGRTLRLLENGDYLQSRYSKYFKDMGVWLAEEVPVSTADHDDVPFTLSGRLDILINAKKLEDPTFDGDPTEEDMAIIEMKSINTWGFKDVAANLQPQPEHYLQIMLYMWLTGIHRGWVLYEDKNDQTAVACPVTYDERAIFGSPDGRSKGVLQEFLEVAQFIDGNKAPERCPQANREKFPCKWKSGACDFYEHCWNPDHDGYFIPQEQEIVEIGGKQFDLNNLPDGVTKEKVIEMKDLWDMMNPVPAPEVTVKAETTVTTTTHMPLPIKAEPGPGELGHTETIVSVDTVVTEFEHNMQRAFKCGKCGNVVTFQRKGKGGTVKCPHCQTSNFVTKLEGKD